MAFVAVYVCSFPESGKEKWIIFSAHHIQLLANDTVKHKKTGEGY